MLTYHADFGLSEAQVHTQVDASAGRIGIVTPLGNYFEGTALANILTGGGSTDYIFSFEGNDTITGGRGSDSLEGGVGNDVYVYNSGDGSDTIGDIQTTASTDIIRFGTGIKASDLSFSRTVNTNDVTINIKTGGSVFIPSQMDSIGWFGVEMLKFADGSSMSAGQIRSALLQQTAGNDTMTLQCTLLPNYNSHAAKPRKVKKLNISVNMVRNTPDEMAGSTPSF